MNALIHKIRRDEAVLRFARKVVAMVPAVDKPEYRPLIYNYARIAILCEQAYSYLHEGSLINSEGELRASLNTYRQLTAELRAAARELGLSPTSAALLAKPVQFLDLDSMRDHEDEDEQ